MERMGSQREAQEAARLAAERIMNENPGGSGTVGGNHGAVRGGSFDLPEDRSRGLYGSGEKNTCLRKIGNRYGFVTPH